MQRCKIFFLVAVIAVGMLACGDDKTELNWTKRTGGSSVVNDITWISTNNVLWDDVLTAEGQTTKSEEISDDSLAGYGMAALDGQTPAMIQTPVGSTLRLSSGTTNNYEINSCK